MRETPRPEPFLEKKKQTTSEPVKFYTKPLSTVGLHALRNSIYYIPADVDQSVCAAHINKQIPTIFNVICVKKLLNTLRVHQLTLVFLLDAMASCSALHLLVNVNNELNNRHVLASISQP